MWQQILNHMANRLNILYPLQWSGYMEWISVKDQLPPVSFIESDDENVPYECHYFLVFSDEKPGIMCVASLMQIQDPEHWNEGDFYWDLYIPKCGGNTIERDFDCFTHWMHLPQPPKEK